MAIQANTHEPERITVKINESASFSETRATITFVEVLEDSRCPEGVDCIWAGNAKISIEISREGKVEQTLELNTNMGEAAKYEGREVNLVLLTPHPKAGVEIDTAAYAAVIELGDISPCEN